jgi:hypothetical protein
MINRQTRVGSSKGMGYVARLHIFKSKVHGALFLTFEFSVLIFVTGCAIFEQVGSSPNAASSTSFTFAVAGDYGTSSDTAATLSLMARSGASFNLALGDLSYNGGSTEESWCDFVKSHFGDVRPFLLIPGNHEDDYGMDGHIRRFAQCLPDKLGVIGDYPVQYYFDYENLARFILVSPDLTIDGKHYYYGENNGNFVWLREAIHGARSGGIPWVIVGMHNNCLSVGVYYCNVYQELLDLLVSERVDLVLHAHEHSYQRTKQISLGATCPSVVVDSFNGGCITDTGDDGVYVRGRGPVFLVVGTAGAELYNVNESDTEAGYFARWMGANASPRKGLMKVTVSPDELSAEFLGSTSSSDFADSFSIRVGQ